MYKVTLCKDGQSEDITDLVGELTWSESIDTVGMSLSFEVPDTEERYVPRLLIMAGDVIKVENGEGDVTEAIVVSVTRDYPKRQVKAYDYGFYLNKNDTVIQFLNVSVTEALSQLFNSLNIPIGSICDMPAKVKGVYIKNVNEIIKELIKIQQDNDGKKYYYELRGAAVYVFQLTEDPIEYIFKPAVNVAAFDVTDKEAHGRGKYTHSIDALKNQVRAVINSKTTGNMPAMEYSVRDDESIKKYGLLSENFSVSSDDYKNIKKLAENELKDKDKLKRELSMDFIGHDKARPGRVMHIADDYLCIDDLFRITSVTHNVKGDIHTMSCTLEYIKEAASSFTEGKVIQREEIKESGGAADSENTYYSSLYAVLDEQVGKPYAWGATGPDSFDCSGLVYYSFNRSGAKSVSRQTAQGYYNSCAKIKTNDRQPGDLVFWANAGGRVYHVGVYIGNNMMINAENENVGVRKTKLWSNVYAYGRL